MKQLVGLLGFPLSHSFSPNYFAKKFKKENIQNTEYKLFEEKDLQSFISKARLKENLLGFNVTIPYKQAIIPFLNSISDEASYIGAVNTVKRVNNKLLGYNTDVYGFEKSIVPLLTPEHNKALIFGTGGASKAVQYVLKQLHIQNVVVSRYKQRGHITYNQITEAFISNHKLLINTTPLGMYPNVDQAVSIPYQSLTQKHLCYDVVYNPDETQFLKQCKQQGAQIKNGLEMLHLQADKSWEIWNDA